MTELEALLMLSICIGAFLMPFLSRRLHLPSAVGEILFGLFLGLFFKEAFHKTSIIKFLGEFGFILLMYLAGLEIDFEKIKITPKRELYLYIAVVALVVVFSFGAAIFYRQPPIYALIYLTTAVGLLFPVLRETGLSGSDTGQKLLIIGSIGEVVSLFSLTLFILYYQSGFSLESLIHLGQFAAFILIAYVLYKLFRLLMWWFPGLVRPFLKTGDPMESGIRANFVNLFVFVSLAALLDMELIVGAFLAGMAYGLIFKEREHIRERIGGFAYGFLIPVFFIEVGLRFDINNLLDINVLLQALVISFVIFFVRLLASMVLFFSRFSLVEILLVPLSTSFALTLLVVIATFGLEHGIISREQAASVLLAAVLTSIIYPALLKRFARRGAGEGVPNL
ncbi:MAG: cation:proton antiporter [Candidatus Aminicenantes bacterium]|nr:cation:proton antiporter [Candidatus Aminicenantes bacterium]